MIMKEKIRLLQTKVCDRMRKLGFEEKQVDHQIVYYRSGKYVKISYENRYVAVEVADSLMEAENNMYEDLDLYEYDCMKGMDISEEMEKDIVHYVGRA